MKGKLSHKNRVVTHTDIQRHFPSIMLGSKVLPYATTVQKTRLSDPCQTSFQSLARGYKMYGNIVFRHIFLEKMRHCLFIQAIREYNLKSPHYGTLISCLVVIILKRPIKWCNLLSYMIFIHIYIIGGLTIASDPSFSSLLSSKKSAHFPYSSAYPRTSGIPSGFRLSGHSPYSPHVRGRI